MPTFLKTLLKSLGHNLGSSQSHSRTARSRQRIRSTSIAERLEDRSLLSAVATVVEDQIPGGGINNTNVSSDPSSMIDVSGTTYFVANDVRNGVELWRINSSGVAEMVEDSVTGGGISPGSSSPNVQSLTNVNGTLYFSANDGTSGTELWRINSSGVAEMVEDAVAGGGIRPGSSGSFPAWLIDVNGTLYFQAFDDVNGSELWRINSSGVAQTVEDAVAGGGIRAGNSSSSPAFLTNVNGTLYFRANDGVNGDELWRINSSGVAQIVEDTVAGGGIATGANSSSPSDLTNVSGTLYFRAVDDLNGSELWRINSSSVAQIVEDAIVGGGIRSGSSGSNLFGLTNVNGTLYFGADDGVNGGELWRINSSGVAQMVEDAVAGGGINPGANTSSFSYLTNVNGTLYFRANEGVNGDELWRINSSGVAQIVEDVVVGGGIRAGNSSSSPADLTNVNGTLYFRANDGVNGFELWRINSSGVAQMVEDVIAGGGVRTGSSGSYPGSLTDVSGKLYFRANDGVNGDELWRINSSGLAEMVEDVVPGGGIRSGSSGSFAQLLTNANGTLYFRANDGVNGYELWRINSSGVAEMIEDAIAGGGINSRSSNSSPDILITFDGTLYFRADDTVNGSELWWINSSGVPQMVEDAVAGGGINPGSSGSSPSYLTNINGTLYFRANDGVNGDELWRINSSGVAQIVEDAVAGGGINPASGSSNPRYLTNVNGTLYFRANDGVNGYELWRINSSGVAQIVEDAVAGGGIRPGNSSSNANALTNVNGTLYFRADDGANGAELWRINSSGVAQIVEDAVAGGGISSGSGGSSPADLTNVNGTLYFRANDGVNGYEVWRINSSGVAQMVEDAVAGGGINPGSGSSGPQWLTNVNGTLYFRANDGVNGYEVWRINSSGVAQMVEDAVAGGGINPGSGSSGPRYLANISGILYFLANDGGNGEELWRINSSGVAQMVEDSIAGGGIRPGSSGSFSRNPTNVNGTVFFTANDGVNGYELWRINSSGIAEMVEDTIPSGGINPGASSSSPQLLTNANGTLYFRADDGVNGIELWRINSLGLAELVEGAVAAGGINPGSGSSNPSWLTASGKNLYFVADDGFTNGNELWVVSLNEAPTDVTLSSQTVAENAGANAAVGSLGFTDPDVGDTGTFSLPSGFGDNGLFNIAPHGTTLRANSSLNFEAKSSYSLTIRVTDAAGLSFDKPFTISVTDVNEALTALSLQNVVSTLPENTGTSTRIRVADIVVTDDALGTNTLSLTGADAASFEIVGTQLFLKAGVSLNFEAKSAFDVNVLVDDATVGTTPDATVPYSLLLSNVNEAPTDIALSVASIGENLPSGIFVGAFSTTDPDASNTFPYSLMDLPGNADDESFTIVDDELRTTVTFDFETQDSYLLRVRATDQGGLSVEKDFLITVTDLVEDVSAPTSRITALPAASSNVVLNIAVTGEDPGVVASGVLEYDLYYSTGGAFVQFATVPAGSPSTTFTGLPNTTYWFRSVARDNVGNEESKISADTYTRIGDVVPPSTQVTTAVPTSSGLFTVQMTGNKPSGTPITAFDVYVVIDSGEPILVGAASSVATGGGNYSGVILFQGILDGVSRTYRFYSRGRDGSGNVEAVPVSGDVSATYSFASAGLTATAIDVQNGVNQRSYVRYLDVLFSTSTGLDALLATGRVKVERFAINTESVTPGNGAPVTGFGLVQNGNKLRLDFGLNGLGGLRQAGNGFYRVLLDLDGNGSFADAGDKAFEFHRLFGDANGNGIVDVADTNLVTSQIGRTGANLNGDLDGNGSVNSTDRLYTTQQRGQQLLTPLLGWLDD